MTRTPPPDWLVGDEAATDPEPVVAPGLAPGAGVWDPEPLGADVAGAELPDPVDGDAVAPGEAVTLASGSFSPLVVLKGRAAAPSAVKAPDFVIETCAE